jgi:hypothetical protein
VTAAQVAIYPVDARGLGTEHVLSLSTPPCTQQVNAPPGPSSSSLDVVRETQFAMQLLASRTGGRAYLFTNDLKGAIRRAIDDARVTYVIGYHPTHNAWDGKFHELNVTVKRSNVDVRHRMGYFAFADPPTTEQSRKVALLVAASARLDATAVGVTLQLQPNMPKPGSPRVRVDIDPGQVSLKKQGERWIGLVDVLYALRTAPSEPATLTTETYNLRFTQARYDEVMKTALKTTKDVDAARAGYQVKVVVRDATTGNLGSVTARTDRLK